MRQYMTKTKTKNSWHVVEHNWWVNAYLQNVTLYWGLTLTVLDGWLK